MSSLHLETEGCFVLSALAPGLILTLLNTRLAVCRLEPGAMVPSWTAGSEFSSITRTAEELSVVCVEHAVPEGIRCEKGWRALKLEGPFDFSQVGILLAVAEPLARAKVVILAIGTYDTDYVLVHQGLLKQALVALRTVGHTVREEASATELCFRPAAADDAEFLYHLHRAAMLEYVRKTWGWDEEWQRRYFREHFDPVAGQVVQCGGRDVGVVSIAEQPDRVFIGGIEILPEYQNRGIGTAILQGVLDRARRLGKPVALQVLKVNPARALYERMGFTVRGETATHWQMQIDPEGMKRQHELKEDP
jgi:GNAT superfamily N-acetyltransferase